MAREAAESLVRSAPRARSALLLRARVRLSLPRLDARLAGGEEAAGDPLLALRSTQLVSGRTRERLASALERVCSRPNDGPPAISAAVPVDVEAVDVARPALEQLGAALRSATAVDARGVALTRRLLTEPPSALFRPQSSEALYEAAREALLALKGRAAA
jgi:hypothetical protein